MLHFVYLYVINDVVSGDGVTILSILRSGRMLCLVSLISEAPAATSIYDERHYCCRDRISSLASYWVDHGLKRERYSKKIRINHKDRSGCASLVNETGNWTIISRPSTGQEQQCSIAIRYDSAICGYQRMNFWKQNFGGWWGRHMTGHDVGGYCWFSLI